MHKNFYASGFLYHLATGKILLQQQDPTDSKSPWSMLGGKSLGAETSEENFKRNARAFLRLNLASSAINPVYDYFQIDMGKKHYVLYAQVKKLEDFAPAQNSVFAWFTIKEAFKLNLSPQTKQNIIVGQRVIDALARKKAGQKTME